jgi:two-component system sensor histidine kinase KdpD
MNATNRADNFLRLIRRSRRGRLKIYLGYAAGVGKTYQMLLEGHRIQEDGIDLAVGLVETHGRAETEILLRGLEVIPRRRVTYRGIEIEEMDLDAILSRRPGVVLVDELAHTNVPGSKNAKRYQDVEALLAAGIHVISTLNIQHLESLYETLERATAVKVRERIPDRVVAEADQLVNVDITVEDLRRRLKEGKVYTRERIETALEHFFRQTNLEQLRELTLRELAAQIDSRRRDPLAEELPSSPDQVMVALSSRGPNSEALLRYASRLAGRLNRNWYAVYVQTSRERPAVIDAATQRMLSNTLTLAQQLGATVFTYKGEDIVKTILQFAREYRVGHIVIGTPGKRVPFWRRLKGEVSLIERLINEGTGVTVVVLDTKALPDTGPITGNADPTTPSDQDFG